ncbi:MAG: hypothetical protein ABI380_13660 [Edaphobacter sp.]
MFCEIKSSALKAYNRGIIWTMSAYVLVTFGATWFVHHHHPKGAEAYAMAVLPSIPIIAMLAVMGIYLRDEKDEFLRWMTIQSLLWATGFVLALTTVVGFLENFAQVKTPPAYLVFVVYWLVFGAVQSVQQWRNRQGGDD